MKINKQVPLNVLLKNSTMFMPKNIDGITWYYSEMTLNPYHFFIIMHNIKPNKIVRLINNTINIDNKIYINIHTHYDVYTILKEYFRDGYTIY